MAVARAALRAFTGGSQHSFAPPLDVRRRPPLASSGVLSVISKLARAGRRSGSGLAVRTMVGTGVAVVLFGASWAGLVSPAGADQISATRDQIGSLQASVVAGAARIRQLTVAYQQAAVQADTLSQQVAADRVQFAR